MHLDGTVQPDMWYVSQLSYDGRWEHVFCCEISIPEVLTTKYCYTLLNWICYVM
jgi:hypothetical protein